VHLDGSSEGKQLAQDPDHDLEATTTNTFGGGASMLLLLLGLTVRFPMPNQEVIASLLIALQKLVALCSGFRFRGLRLHSFNHASTTAGATTTTKADEDQTDYASFCVSNFLLVLWQSGVNPAIWIPIALTIPTEIILANDEIGSLSFEWTISHPTSNQLNGWAYAIPLFSTFVPLTSSFGQVFIAIEQ